MAEEVRKPSGDPVLHAVLLAQTAVTGVVDAVSFLALGHIFTANMTGNVVFLGFALAGVPGLSAARSLASLGAFLLGAILGGQLANRMGGVGRSRWLGTAFLSEAGLLLAAALVALGRGNVPGDDSVALYALIVLTALAMGIRNATVRKLAVPDLTTTVLTLTVTGLAADSSLAGGTNPRWATRVTAIVSMFVGAGIGALLLRRSIAVPLFLSGAIACVCGATMFRRQREVA
jgi:uncharacterized membrane protein YoaK (UPF0700 family)